MQLTTIKLDTERFTLRPLTSQDAEALFAIFSDTDVMRYWNTPPWDSLHDATQFIKQSHEDLTTQKALTLAIVSKGDKALIGKCLLFSWDKESRRAEIGFGIAKSQWGQGVIPEIGTALIDYAFSTLKLRRIEAEIDPANIGSAKVLAKLGFTKEGHLRARWEIAGDVSDSALYGLLASDPR
ncbi:GNAT family N-acetyltransferase [Pseudoalteromonas sp. McH1-7]|uniref:GNAT family N-acetyltransferase n=1 Tax=Pseudoalteromonas sp. McH1-7 TaxID=2745574 RepID=UPI001590EABE|nr:GNAT family N-acetyltransferase [Pseudoalteromonas sp. McH1-7]NUZ09881.1 GNAT family N-acetyltransferase [Pseudoalteromonas sp. McH1-7]